ncbi:transposase [Patescibacteria group bacterium]|nr:transposase [Patescibacteria group bacterium]
MWYNKTMEKIRNFVNGKIYHLYNRGVAKQKIFGDSNDYQRLLDNFAYYLDIELKTRISMIKKEKLIKVLSANPKKPMISIISYCLMPNHFHLMVEQLKNGGTSQFMKDSLNSFARYFNTKYDRVGPIFQGRFKSVEIEDEDQLIHLSRYIHINPCIANLVEKPKYYQWSSFKLFIKNKTTRLCNPEMILEIIGSPKKYKEFVQDYAEYAKKLLEIDNLLLE